jgi:hypothetical protein
MLRPNQAQAAATFRARSKAAIDAYHTSVGMIWRAFGRPGNSTTNEWAAPCAFSLQMAWDALRAKLRAASDAMNATNARPIGGYDLSPHGDNKPEVF